MGHIFCRIGLHRFRVVDWNKSGFFFFAVPFRARCSRCGATR